MSTPNFGKASAVTPDRVMGVDPSLTSTGVAFESGYTNSLQTTGRRNDDIHARWRRLEAIASFVADEATELEAKIVVVEHPIDVPGGSKIDRFGLFWLIIDQLEVNGFDVYTASPSARCLAATGKGRAPKSEVIDAMRNKYPSATIRNDDEADALALIEWYFSKAQQ